MPVPQWVEVCCELANEAASDDGSASSPSSRIRRGSSAGSISLPSKSFWWLRERELLLAGPRSGAGTSPSHSHSHSPGAGTDGGVGAALPQSVFVRPLDSNTHQSVPREMVAKAWEAINLLDISHVSVYDKVGVQQQLRRRKSLSMSSNAMQSPKSAKKAGKGGGYANANANGGDNDKIDELVKNVAFSPEALSCRTGPCKVQVQVLAGVVKPKSETRNAISVY